jgi:ABC-type transport system involved in cytochrome c biogenesis permease component
MLGGCRLVTTDSQIHTFYSSLHHALSLLSLPVFTGCLITASKAVVSSYSVFTSLLAGDYLTTNGALLRNVLQPWGLLCLPRLHQGRLSATTSDGSIFQLLTADSRLPELYTETVLSHWSL